MRVISEINFFAFGALTIMLAILVRFDLQSFWDLAYGLSLNQAKRSTCCEPIT